MTLALINLSFPALANHAEGHKPVHTIIVNVSGMVCDFCARSIEKVFYKEEGVEGVIINLDNQTVTLETAAADSLTDEKIKELIVYSGYKLLNIQHED
jgi:copper chaperone CopZ